MPLPSSECGYSSDWRKVSSIQTSLVKARAKLHDIGLSCCLLNEEQSYCSRGFCGPPVLCEELLHVPTWCTTTSPGIHMPSKSMVKWRSYFFKLNEPPVQHLYNFYCGFCDSSRVTWEEHVLDILISGKWTLSCRLENMNCCRVLNLVASSLKLKPA